MEKALTFFRVFDLAFFAPGTLLLVVGWFSLVPDPRLDLTTAETLFALFAFVAAAFCLGLVVHALVRFLLKPRLEKMGRRSLRRRPLPDYFEEATRSDLILYFWYLRATCWNLAFSLVVSAVLLLVSGRLTAGMQGLALLALIVGAAVLFALGNSYHAVLEHTKSFHTFTEPTHVPRDAKASKN